MSLGGGVVPMAIPPGYMTSMYMPQVLLDIIVHVWCRFGNSCACLYTCDLQQPSMMVRGPLLAGGGDARPVQIPAEVQSSDTAGFGFLGKTTKSSAFDFVQDEMRSATQK